MGMNQETIQRYIAYVDSTIKQFSEIGDLINESTQDISPQRLNKALAMFYNVSLSLNSEYQRQKINQSALELEYQVWYDEKFLEAKKAVIDEYAESKSIKPSVKEFETQLRSANREEWLEWELRMKESDARTQFLLRLRETLNKYDNILVAIAQNMRSEMKTMSIVERANSENRTFATRRPIS